MANQWIRRLALGAGVFALGSAALLAWALAVVVGPYIADGIVVLGKVIPPRDPRLAYHMGGWRVALSLAGVIAIAGAYRCYRGLLTHHATRPTAP